MKTQHYESLGKYKLKAPWDTTLHPQLYLESVGRWHVLGRMWTQRHLHLLLVGMCNDSVWLFLRMLNSDMPRDPAILLLRSFRRNESVCPCRDVSWVRVLMTALFTAVSKWKRPKCPLTSEWIKKKVGYSCNGILFDNTKKQSTDTC